MGVEFPDKFRKDSPGATARGLIAAAREARRREALTPDDVQLTEWAREFDLPVRRCSCGKRCYDSHVVAARHACFMILILKESGTKWKIYHCGSSKMLHVGR